MNDTDVQQAQTNGSSQPQIVMQQMGPSDTSASLAAHGHAPYGVQQPIQGHGSSGVIVQNATAHGMSVQVAGGMYSEKFV